MTTWFGRPLLVLASIPAFLRGDVRSNPRKRDEDENICCAQCSGGLLSAPLRPAACLLLVVFAAAVLFFLCVCARFLVHPRPARRLAASGSQVLLATTRPLLAGSMHTRFLEFMRAAKEQAQLVG
jgi:hypothetical protein